MSFFIFYILVFKSTEPTRKLRTLPLFGRADAQTCTADLVFTKDVLYCLSYIGLLR